MVSVVASNALAIRTLGLGTYLKRFFALNPLLLFVGLLELLQEFTKFITFSFRLYGNISAGEAVLGTMSDLVAFIVPVPFLGFEMLVAVIQGMIFALLTLAFMTILTEPHHKEEREHMNFTLSVSGGLIVAIGGSMPGLAIGLIGMKAMEAIGRNPEASGRIVPIMVLAMAFAESIAIYSLIFAFLR